MQIKHSEALFGAVGSYLLSHKDFYEGAWVDGETHIRRFRAMIDALEVLKMIKAEIEAEREG